MFDRSLGTPFPGSPLCSSIPRLPPVQQQNVSLLCKGSLGLVFKLLLLLLLLLFVSTAVTTETT